MTLTIDRGGQQQQISIDPVAVAQELQPSADAEEEASQEATE